MKSISEAITYTIKACLILCIMILAGLTFCEAQVRIYPAPKGSILNADYILEVRSGSGPWLKVPVYNANVAKTIGTKRVRERSAMAYFDFDGKIEMAVTNNKGMVRSARIRPLGYSINYQIKDNRIVFSAERPMDLSVETNGDIWHNLQIFTNHLETNVPDQKDPGVIFYGPGIHNIGTLKVPDNTLVYVAGGAIVRGQILVNDAKNVRIRGRGILTQLDIHTTRRSDQAKDSANIIGRNDGITLVRSSNIEISDIIVLPVKYSLLIGESKDVRISGMRSISYDGNADGIDIFCSTNIKIDHVFMRNSDDCIAIYGHRWSFYGNVKDVEVSNSILWADVAHPILIGTHGDSLDPDTISKIKFTDLHILEQFENQIDYQGAMSINAGDSNFISDIRFEKISVEEIRNGQLFNLRVMYNKKYNTSPGNGIENVLFKDITYKGERDNISVIAGYDGVRAIKNIRFENLSLNGRIISDDMPEKPAYYKTSDLARIFIGEHVENVKFMIGPTIIN